ncbi:MAG: type II secretion system protein [Planctomycetota bacterium]
MKRTSQGMAGFTLVELLVVIAIIAVLLSILVPALNRVRDQAKAVICLSNMKQVSYGWVLYGQDYRDRCIPYYLGCEPTAASMQAGVTGRYTTELVRMKYVADVKAFICRAGESWKYWQMAVDHPDPRYGGIEGANRAVNIGYNWINLGTDDRVNSSQGGSGGGRRGPVTYAHLWNTPNMSMIKRPSETIHHIDTACAWDKFKGCQACYDQPLPYAPYYVADPRHFGAVNIAWVDGHAGKLQILRKDQRIYKLADVVYEVYAILGVGRYSGVQHTLDSLWWHSK